MHTNGHAQTLPTLQTWLVASGPLGHNMSLPEDRPLTEAEAAMVHNVSSMRIDMTRRMMDPRRDVREAAGLPRNIPDALAFLRLYQDDSVAGAVVERYPDETYKVAGEVWDGDSSPYGSGSNDEYEPPDSGDEEGNTGGGGSEFDLGGSQPRSETTSRNAEIPAGPTSGATGETGVEGDQVEEPTDGEQAPTSGPAETPFNKAWADLQAQMRTGGSKSYYKGEEYSPFWKLMRDWDVASRVGRYGVLYFGLDDGKRPEEPAAGLEEEGSVSDGYEFDYKVSNGVQPDDDEFDDPKRVRDGGWEDRGGRRVVFNVAKKTGNATANAGRHRPWSLTWNAESDGAKKMGESDKPLLYCRVFTEAHAVPVQWERNKASPRYGQPTMWHVDFGDPLNTGAVTGPSDTARVHWTRVLALKSDARFNSNVLAGVPACWPVYAEIYNLQKYSAASGEGYWTSGLPLRYMKTPAQIAGARTVVRRQSVRDETERMLSSVGDRFGIFENLEPGQLPAEVIDPTPFVDNDLKKVAMSLNMPVRKLLGSERGELASSEDEGDWNDVIRGRQQKRAIPEQVVPCVDRFILYGLLPEPQGGEFSCGWPAVDALGRKEMADVFSASMTGLKSWTDAGGDAIIAPEDVLVEFFGKTPEEAQAMLERAAEASAQRQQDEMDQQAQMIDQGLAPDPTEPVVSPEQANLDHDKQVLDIASKVRPSGPPKPSKPPTRNEADGWWDAEHDCPVFNKATGKTKLTGGQWVTLDNGVKVYLKSGKVVAGPKPVVEAMSGSEPGAKGKRSEESSGAATGSGDGGSGPSGIEKRSPAKLKTIARDIRIRQRFASPPDVSAPDGVKAIRDYTGDEVFASANKALRSGKDLADVPPPSLRNLQKVASQDLPKPTTVYRGVSDGVFNSVYSGLKPGAEVTAKGFVSTTLDPKVTAKFGTTVLSIKAKKGVYVEEYSKFSGEHEVVQAHGTRYKFLKTEDGVDFGGKKSRVVHLEEI